MSNVKLDNTMKEILVTPPYTYVVMAQIVAEHQEILLKIQAGVPVFLFHGMCENGKTSTVIACMENEDNVARFSDSYNDLKRKVVSTNVKESFLTDNYPQYISSLGKQQGKRKLEYLVDQGSEKSEIPLIMISAEDYIFKDLSDSFRSRMLEVEVPKIESDESLYKLRDYLRSNKEEYIRLLNTFSNWYQNRVNKEDMKKALEEFRKRHSGYSKRTTGMVFSYYYFGKMLSKFLEEEFKEGLDIQRIEKNYKQLLKWKEEGKKRANTTLAGTLLRNLLRKENVLQVVEPKPGYYCRKYVEGKCYKDCGDFPRCCYSLEEKDALYYDPMDLRIGINENAAILIRNPKQIYQYPKHICYEGPILIIRNDDLLRLINIELAAFCYENNIMREGYGPKMLNKELFQNNLCLYHYWNSKHRTYVFDYIDILDNSKEKVILIKLSDNQYEFLSKQAKSDAKLPSHGRYEECCMTLEKLCQRVQSLVGKEQL